jgi:hypothetical protein
LGNYFAGLFILFIFVSMVDLDRYSKLGNISVQPITIRICNIVITELLDNMITDKGDISDRGNSIVEEVGSGPMYQEVYGAPTGLLFIGYCNGDKSCILVSLDLGEDYDLLEDKCIEVYNWLGSDRFIKY